MNEPEPIHHAACRKSTPEEQAGIATAKFFRSLKNFRQRYVLGIADTRPFADFKVTSDGTVTAL